EEGTVRVQFCKVMQRLKGKGGFRASSFIYANMVSMVLYLSLKMHFSHRGSANTVTNLHGVDDDSSSLLKFATTRRIKVLRRWDSTIVLWVTVAVALGTGGVRGALPALGADQFEGKGSKLGRYFAGSC
ncbi:hypothetical protein HAX54_003405, partial [Datura stramonium]|nr:hypothetical protein [Datura stramonium]